MCCLVALALVLMFCLWKRLRSDTKAYFIALVSLLVSYICFYARYYDWSGDNAWGDRFVSTPTQMLAMMSVPLLMRHRTELKRWGWELGKAVVAASVTIQIASVFFWNSLEVWQLQTLDHPTFVVGLRFLNIIRFALGVTDRWGLSSEQTQSLYRVTTPYFFPFMVLRQRTASPSKIAILITGWICLLAAVLGSLLLVRIKTREWEECARIPISDTAPESNLGEWFAPLKGAPHESSAVQATQFEPKTKG